MSDRQASPSRDHEEKRLGQEASHGLARPQPSIPALSEADCRRPGGGRQPSGALKSTDSGLSGALRGRGGPPLRRQLRNMRDFVEGIERGLKGEED